MNDLANQVNTTIHPSDEMMAVMRKSNMGEAAYIQSGKNNTNVFYSIIERYKPELLRGKSILDHGCGFGRMTRHFRNSFEASKVVAADVTANMVEFCEKNLDVVPLLISDDSAISRSGHKFDIIISVSVFSHLPPEKFLNTMRDLRASLEPGGILIFTIAGEFVAKTKGVSIGDEGYRYGRVGRSKNETQGRLSEKEYSSMFVKPWYVAKVLADSDLTLLEYKRQGHVGVQDVFVVEPVQK